MLIAAACARGRWGLFLVVYPQAYANFSMPDKELTDSYDDKQTWL